MSTEKPSSESMAEIIEPAPADVVPATEPEPTDAADSVSEAVDTQAQLEATASEEDTPSAPKEVQEPAGEKPEIRELRQAREEQAEIEGKVIGWNRGGFHVVIGDITAFCPRSEMELGSPLAPEEYLDKSFHFQVLKVQKKGRRIVVSRTAAIKSERSKARAELRSRIEVGSTLTGRVASLTGFGAFIDIGGGIQGLVHISEISHQRIDTPEDVLEVGQEVQVKVLKIEKGGKRISLSMRALEDNPWNGLRDRYPPGATLKGRVHRTTRHGVWIELEPGLTGLLPSSTLSLPPTASIARAYPPGREVSIQIMQIDERRHRIALALEGSTLEGTWHDFQDYRKQQESDDRGGFNALANALKKAQLNDE